MFKTAPSDSFVAPYAKVVFLVAVNSGFQGLDLGVFYAILQGTVPDSSPG